MNRNLAPFLILMAAVLWGTVGTAKTWLPNDVDSISLGAMRLLIGSLILLVIAVSTGQLKRRG